MPAIDSTFGASTLSLDQGAPEELLQLVLPLAWKYLFFLFVIALIVEAFGKSPVEQRDYASVVWRLVLVMVMLTFYREIFGTVVNIAGDLARAVSPQSMALRLKTDFNARAQAYWSVGGDKLPPPGSVEADAAAAKQALPLLGGMLFQSLVGFVSLLGLLAHRILGWFASVMIMLCYVIGPLALVFSVPRISAVGTKWFGQFVSYCTWPIISGLILTLVSALGIHLDGGSLGNSLESVAVSLLFLLTAAGTPFVAQQLIGGNLHNALTQGASTGARLATGVQGAAAAAASGGGHAAATAGASAAAQSSAALNSSADAACGTSSSTPINTPGGGSSGSADRPPCSRCNGQGHIQKYGHVESGVCFNCWGRG